MKSRGITALILAIAAWVLFGVPSAHADQTLYNGIQLSDPWPPQDRQPTRDPMSIPYLERPPKVIVIDVGRQLFVDDFLIEKTDMKRTYHAAEYVEGNPVLKPDKPWEIGTSSQEHPAPTAMAFSDGVWYDSQDKVFKMWYMGGYSDSTCYATSRDGIAWDKPDLDIVPGTNIVQKLGRDSNVIWLDLVEKDPDRRYKMLVFARTGSPRGVLSIFFSKDGLHWGECAAISGPLGDRSTAFFNPFRNVWVYSIRDYDPKTIGRFRRYAENADILEGAKWNKGEPPFWIGADSLDPPRKDLNTPCELYNLDVVAYESLCVGLFSIWRGQPKDRAKPNEICVGFSRDGFHWQRPTHDAFIPVSEHYGDWNWGNVQSAGGCFLVVGDKLYFYVSGRSGVAGSAASGESSTGLATLRRDGFASMDASDAEATLTTRPVRFSGKNLFVNANSSKGELRAEVLDAEGKPLPGLARNECAGFTGDSTAAPLHWKGDSGLASCNGKDIRFRFYLRNGSLYSFWVSSEASGASNGYVAAGGPGFTGPTDTVGNGAAR